MALKTPLTLMCGEALWTWSLVTPARTVWPWASQLTSEPCFPGVVVPSGFCKSHKMTRERLARPCAK